jgi:cytochrome bd-type quinol oxidase subunit 2
MFALIPLGAAILAGIVYIAVSKKSPFKLRIAALAALALMILTVIVCLFIIFGGNSAPRAVVLSDNTSEAPPPADPPNIMPLIMFLILLLALFLMVFITTMRERKRKEGSK